MNNEIFVRSSLKTGFNGREHHIVTIGNFVYLRVLSDDGYNYEVVTATADEDDKRFRAVDKQELLIEIARQMSKALGLEHSDYQDNYGRNYVGICRFKADEGVWPHILKVFQASISATLNGRPQAESEARNELRELYDALAPDESGEDVYVSDGVWLSSGGSMKDSGR